MVIFCPNRLKRKKLSRICSNVELKLYLGHKSALLGSVQACGGQSKVWQRQIKCCFIIHVEQRIVKIPWNYVRWFLTWYYSLWGLIINCSWWNKTWRGGSELLGCVYLYTHANIFFLVNCNAFGHTVWSYNSIHTIIYINLGCFPLFYTLTQLFYLLHKHTSYWAMLHYQPVCLVCFSMCTQSSTCACTTIVQ